MPNTDLTPSSPDSAAVQFYLRQARQYQRAAQSDSPALALPILRRILHTGVCGQLSLPQLFQQRHTVQRKHVLRMLALEAGFASWEAFRPVLQQGAAPQLQAAQFMASGAGQLKLWFADHHSAAQYVAEQGGTVLGQGTQAVVMPAVRS
ncbi:hypothetical protein [Chitinibacter sp. ZOR0017]|uniref:hypothetical protein n=1 Tax=Chitinibacter sp. ZOR0017 TaxID=1339254 RepID=UPI000648C90D|nr:hypothetical protein [Chitinibacter sp. ZOR0017]